MMVGTKSLEVETILKVHSSHLPEHIQTSRFNEPITAVLGTLSFNVSSEENNGSSIIRVWDHILISIFLLLLSISRARA